jgi:hypothetical protein
MNFKRLESFPIELAHSRQGRPITGGSNQLLDGFAEIMLFAVGVSEQRDRDLQMLLQGFL